MEKFSYLPDLGARLSAADSCSGRRSAQKLRNLQFHPSRRFFASCL